MSSALPAFAAESLQEWLDSESEKEAERIAQIESYLAEEYGECEMISYPMKHIKDTLFFQKVSFFNGMDKFISDENDIVTLAFYKEDDVPQTALIFNASYGAGNIGYDQACTTGFEDRRELVPEEFVAFLENIDADIKAGDFGKISDVSLLFSTLPAVRLDNQQTHTVIFVSFVYIQSEKDEFLVPYMFFQKRGELVLENGKIYTLKECTKIMSDELSLVKSSMNEVTDEALFNPFEIVIPAVLCIAVAVGIFFGAKALLAYFKTQSNDDYDF